MMAVMHHGHDIYFNYKAIDPECFWWLCCKSLGGQQVIETGRQIVHAWNDGVKMDNCWLTLRKYLDSVRTAELQSEFE